VPCSTAGRSANVAGSAPCLLRTRTGRQIARSSTVHEVGSALNALKGLHQSMKTLDRKRRTRTRKPKSSPACNPIAGTPTCDPLAAGKRAPASDAKLLVTPSEEWRALPFDSLGSLRAGRTRTDR
jgi:hypothetical protein